MKRLSCLATILLLMVFPGFRTAAQTTYAISYPQLKEYEGVYEFTNHTSLQIAASPRDNMLYAIIGVSRYKLTPAAKDVFLNGGKQEVRFLRDPSGITGYTVKNDHPDLVFKLLTKKVSFTENMWYARATHGQPFQYHYEVPVDKHDGLATGSILQAGLDTALIRTLVNRIVDGTYSNIHSILILKNGKLVLEEYFYDNDVNTLHELRSATKSFSSALVGIAIDKGLIKSKDVKMISFFPEYTIDHLDQDKGAITLEDLLTQRSGLACNDDDGSSPGNEVKIYPTDDWVKFVLDLPMGGKPGDKALYCSGNITLLDRIVEKASGKSLHDFAQYNLFGPLGIRNFKWDFVPDKSHEDDYGQVNLRSRDMAKFGLLYLHHGQWNGRQVISENWVRQSVTPHTVMRDIDYGYLWWCENLSANGVRYKGFEAKGNGGQRIFVWPGLDMVAVITAGNYNIQSPANRLLIDCVLGGVKQ